MEFNRIDPKVGRDCIEFSRHLLFIGPEDSPPLFVQSNKFMPKCIVGHVGLKI